MRHGRKSRRSLFIYTLYLHTAHILQKKVSTETKYNIKKAKPARSIIEGCNKKHLENYKTSATFPGHIYM